MKESTENRLRRLHMRSMRRGIKEMDLILSTFAGRHLHGMDEAGLDLYDRLLMENDQDLYQWVTGQSPTPEPFVELIEQISQTFQKREPG